MMKLLITSDTIGGVWTYTLDLIKALEKYNVQVILATLGQLPSENQLSEVRKLPSVSLYSVPYKLEWMNDPWDDLEKSQRWLLNLVFSLHPDVIHLNSYAFNASLFNTPSVVVGHSCVLSWWEAVKNEPAPSQWNRYEGIVRRGLQSASVVVAPSYYMLNSLSKHYGPLSHTGMIYNATDSSNFLPGRKEKIIFSMGRLWDEGKNIKLLLDAAKSFSYPVFIAGELKNTISNVPSNVTFLGHLTKKEIANWLSRAAVYVSPALYEPFGLSAMEAAHSGCALVLGKIHSLQEIWKGNALFCNPYNSDELVTQIEKIMHDDNLRQKLSQLAILKASEYQLSSMAESYIILYRELIEKSKLLKRAKKEIVTVH